MTDTPAPMVEHKVSAPDAYLQSRCEIEVYKPAYLRMKRTGITSPGYPEFAVYKPKGLDGYIGDLWYVYEGGLFWESAAWRDYYRANGKTPYQVRQETPHDQPV